MARGTAPVPGHNDFEDFVRELPAAAGVMGGVLGLAPLAGPTWVKAFGAVTTPAGRRPAAAEDRFLLTSVTKPLTALQILELVDRGLVSLQTPVAEIVPEFAAGCKEEVRIWHVLTHTSGVASGEGDTVERPNPGMDAGDHLRAACSAGMAFDPGARVAYSSSPFWVLGEVIRRRSGLDHVEHLRRGLARPLGLRATGYEPGAAAPERYVLPASEDSELPLVAEQVRRSAYPAGGIVSTAEDLLAVGRMLLHGGRSADGRRVLSAAAVRTLWRSWSEGLPGVRDYEGARERTERGLGWALGGPGDLRSDATLWHSGGSGTSMWVDPEAQIVVVLLTATWFLPYGLLARVSNLATAAAG